MTYLERFGVKPGHHVKLADIDPGFKGDHESHDQADAELEHDRQQLRALQDLFYADGRIALLICLQALDAGGKDGTIVVEYLDGLGHRYLQERPP